MIWTGAVISGVICAIGVIGGIWIDRYWIRYLSTPLKKKSKEDK